MTVQIYTHSKKVFHSFIQRPSHYVQLHRLCSSQGWSQDQGQRGQNKDVPSFTLEEVFFFLFVSQWKRFVLMSVYNVAVSVIIAVDVGDLQIVTILCVGTLQF